MEEAKLNPSEEGQAPKPGEEGVQYATAEEVKNLQKGIENLASKVNEFGGKKEGEQDSPKPTEQKPQYSPVVKRIYTKDVPEIEEVWDEMSEEAQALGVDPIEYYESKKGWQLEAKARLQAKQKKDEVKSKIDEPSGVITEKANIDFAKITPEQIRQLNPKAREQYRDYLRRTEGGVKIIRNEQS